jgi:hypothetical protein
MSMGTSHWPPVTQVKEKYRTVLEATPSCSEPLVATLPLETKETRII